MWHVVKELTMIANVVEKLSAQIKEMFARELEFVVLTPYSDGVDAPFSEIVLRNRKAKKIVKANDLLFPITIENSLYGVAIVKKAIDLPSEDIEKIEALIDLVLVSYLEASDKNERLRQLAAYLEISLSSNVIYFNKMKTRSPILKDEVQTARRQAIFLTPILLEGEAGTDFHNYAFDIHQRAGRGSFISWNDLDQSRMNSVQGWVELGDMTIFIPSLGQLTSDQQEIVEAYLLDHADETTPRIIAAIQGPLQDLVENKLLSNRLAFYFSKAHFSIPPLHHRKEDLLDMIDFFSRAHSQGQKDLSSYGLETLNYLTEYGWPGNEKELETDIKKLVDLRIEPVPVDALPVKIIGPELKQLYRLAHSKSTLKEATDELEQKWVNGALERSSGNKSEASRLLGLSRSAFLEKLEKLERQPRQ
jgi:DNA-binding NtrC family response regulator